MTDFFISTLFCFIISFFKKWMLFLGILDLFVFLVISGTEHSYMADSLILRWFLWLSAGSLLCPHCLLPDWNLQTCNFSPTHEFAFQFYFSYHRDVYLVFESGYVFFFKYFCLSLLCLEQRHSEVCSYKAIFLWSHFYMQKKSKWLWSKIALFTSSSHFPHSVQF